MTEASFFDSNTLDLIWTMSLIGVLFAAGAYALALLPWTDREIASAHRAAVSLLFPPRRALVRAKR